MTGRTTETAVEWVETEDGVRPKLRGKTAPVIWAPQPGSQQAFLRCPIRECLFEGTRGNGKTDALIMDYARDVGRGLGRDWRGIIFRKQYSELGEVIERTHKFFPRIFSGARYTESPLPEWSFAGGESLLLRAFERDRDYDKYHGHEYPFIGFEELTNWATDVPLVQMISTNRSSNPRVRRRIRANANPYGVGHTWVKRRYRLSGIPQHIKGRVIKDAVNRDGSPAHWRVYVHGSFIENKILLRASPDYPNVIASSAKNNSQLRAWKLADWDVVAGGMFDDVWDATIHVVPDFPLRMIPATWYVDRSYDHGQSRPFSVGWWAESNGEPFTWNGRVYGQKRGDLYRIAEWYGWITDQPNEGLNMTALAIGRGIAERESRMGIRDRCRPGPADTQIFDNSELREDGEPVRSVASDMEKVGVKWKPADKGPGTRKQGWQQIRQALLNATAANREGPGVFVRESCDQSIRIIPTLPRDDRDLDDIDDKAEGHIADEWRYRLRFSRVKPAGGWTGW